MSDKRNDVDEIAAENANVYKFGANTEFDILPLAKGAKWEALICMERGGPCNKPML